MPIYSIHDLRRLAKQDLSPRCRQRRRASPAVAERAASSVKEVAARLGVCRAVAYRLCERGEQLTRA